MFLKSRYRKKAKVLKGDESGLVFSEMGRKELRYKWGGQKKMREWASFEVNKEGGADGDYNKEAPKV